MRDIDILLMGVVILLFTVVLAGVCMLIRELILGLNETLRAKKYIKSGGLHQPKIEIVEFGSGEFEINVLGVTSNNSELKTRTIKEHLVCDDTGVGEEFRRIVKSNGLAEKMYRSGTEVSRFGRVFPTNQIITEFKSLEEAKLVVKCLYEAHESAIEMNKKTVVVDDCRDEYNEAKAEERIRHITKELEELKEKKNNNNGHTNL